MMNLLLNRKADCMILDEVSLEGSSGNFVAYVMAIVSFIWNLSTNFREVEYLST